MVTINAILQNIRPDIDFTKESNLMSEGILDSLDLIRLVHELEVNYKISIGFKDIVQENFNSVDAIERYIKSVK